MIVKGERGEGREEEDYILLIAKV